MYFSQLVFWRSDPTRSLNHCRIIFHIEITRSFYGSNQPMFQTWIIFGRKIHDLVFFRNVRHIWTVLGLSSCEKRMFEHGRWPTPLLLLPCQAPSGLVKFHILWGSPLRTVPLTVYSKTLTPFMSFQFSFHQPIVYRAIRPLIS